MILFYFIAGVFAEECKPAEAHEDLRVFILTSGPGNTPYTRVGHTALWVSGGGKRETVFNWGAYDSSQDNFLWHFFMGDAKYKLAMMSRPYNLRRVKQNGQKLVAQHLNLTPEMTLAMAAELARLAHPDNQVYTYHWEKQNCATLIRDLLDEVTNGAISRNSTDLDITRRFEVLRHLQGSGWPWFGWHYMASDYGDRTYNTWEAMHIPKRLYDELQTTTIPTPSGDRPLIDYECELNDGGWAPESPNRDWTPFLLVGISISGLMAVWRKNQNVLSSVCLSTWFLMSGLMSTFFMGCWLLSSLDGYGPNENWFYSNPLHLLAPWILWRRQYPSWLRYCWAGMTALGVVFEILGFTTQDNLDWILFFGIPNLCFTWVLMSGDASSAPFQKLNNN